MAFDVLLQTRPPVPSEPVFGSGSQKSGEATRYTISDRVGGLNWLFTGTNTARVFLCSSITSVAPSKLSFKMAPIWRNVAIERQHVFSSQEPETPWHLQTTCMLSSTDCKSNATYYNIITYNKPIIHFSSGQHFKPFFHGRSIDRKQKAFDREFVPTLEE